MADERISVVIPARNEEEYVRVALQSVIEQRYRADLLECIVADNGSTDGTASAVREFANRHPGHRIVLASEPIPGVGRAKNRGAQAATGDILVFLDADSRMAPDLAQAVVSCYRAGSPAGSIRVEADSRDLLDRGFFALMEIGKVWFGIRAQMMYCDRQLFLSLGGFDPDLRQAEDLEFLKRVKERVRQAGSGTVCHVRASRILTSPRRLRERPFRLGMWAMFARWALAFTGIGRKREY